MWGQELHFNIFCHMKLLSHEARLFDAILTAKGIAGAGRGIPGARGGAVRASKRSVGMQSPLPSRHLLARRRLAVAGVAPSARAQLFRGAVAGRSGLPSAARILATSSRPPAAPFAVQTRPPCAPLSRGIPGNGGQGANLD